MSLIEGGRVWGCGPCQPRPVGCASLLDASWGSCVQIMKQLKGEEELPWEGDKNTDARRKLGLFRQPILSLLEREPTQRATLAAFCNTCQQTFASTSTASGRLPTPAIR